MILAGWIIITLEIVLLLTWYTAFISNETGPIRLVKGSLWFTFRD